MLRFRNCKEIEMKRVFGALLLLVCVCFTGGCLHDELKQGCSWSGDGLSFSGNCAFELDDLVDDLRDRLED